MSFFDSSCLLQNQLRGAPALVTSFHMSSEASIQARSNLLNLILQPSSNCYKVFSIRGQILWQMQFVFCSFITESVTLLQVERLETTAHLCHDLTRKMGTLKL